MTQLKTKNSRVGLRPADTVMRLERMGAFHQCRLSFMRVLLRRLRSQMWQFDRPIWHISTTGVGVATYRAKGPQRTYTLIAFAHDLPPDKRSDRVIADSWDATFTLYDGEPSDSDITRLAQNVPLQEAGRLSATEFCLSRANRSVRLFDYVVNCLANGKQPSSKEINSVGYLMRTTAVYGSGKFGAADRDVWSNRPEFAGSFQPELLTVWLIRTFTVDLVEHLAYCKAPNIATKLSANLRSCFGVGNSTGLGMAPFLLTHPSLLHNWINARETALARVRSIAVAADETRKIFRDRLQRSLLTIQDWNVAHDIQMAKVIALRSDLQRVVAQINSGALDQTQPWNALYLWAENHLCLEAQELLVSLMLEPHPELVDELANTMSSDESRCFQIDGKMPLKTLKHLFEKVYAWAQGLDFNQHEQIARVWYVSEEKLEPRLGERFEEPIEAYEQPLSPARDAIEALTALREWDETEMVSVFLMRHPEYRHIVRRVQHATNRLYAEICDNTISATMTPVDLLRCKLAFFGATKFDPRSDRWVRITMFQGAPFPDELADVDPDDAFYPTVSGS